MSEPKPVAPIGNYLEARLKQASAAGLTTTSPRSPLAAKLVEKLDQGARRGEADRP